MSAILCLGKGGAAGRMSFPLGICFYIVYPAPPLTSTVCQVKQTDF